MYEWFMFSDSVLFMYIKEKLKLSPLPVTRAKKIEKRYCKIHSFLLEENVVNYSSSCTSCSTGLQSCS